MWTDPSLEKMFHVAIETPDNSAKSSADAGMASSASEDTRWTRY